ncbi:MAG: hypothetical protein Q9168_004408 [Polycauliona sp. 1 TL-2023]
MSTFKSAGLKRSLEDATDEPSGADSSHAIKRQHLDKSSNDTLASSHSIMTGPMLLPQYSDSPATLHAKLTTILSKVTSGQSLAAATSFIATPNIVHDPVTKATQAMDDNQRMQWDAYIANPGLLKPIDWTKDIEPAPTSKRPLQNAKRRAEALNRLYGTDKALPGNAVWFTKNHEHLLPLVKAMARVIGAERDICGGTHGLAKADLQTINAILKTVGAIAAKKDGTIKGSMLASVQGMLGAERQRLRGLLG